MADLLLACLQWQQVCVPASALDGAGGTGHGKPLCITGFLGLRMFIHTHQAWDVLSSGSRQVPPSLAALEAPG